MTDWTLTRRSAAAGGLLLLGVGAAFAQAGKVRPDLYLWEDGDPTLESPRETLTAVARMTPEGEPGPRLTLTGRVTSWQKGLPAADVVVMAYQTNAVGKYDRVADSSGAGRIRLRGWTRTGADGRYTFQTIKPGMYPTWDQPAHIHMTVFEPGRRPYWIDNAEFEGEPLVDAAYIRKQRGRGGSGIVRLTKDASGILIAARDIRLERHPGQT